METVKKTKKKQDKQNEKEISKGEAKIARNPLNIPEILEKILQNIVTVRDLKKIREVNKFWLETCLEHWRNTAVFILNEESEQALKTGLGLNATNSPFKLHRILGKPFKNYKLTGNYSFPPSFPISPVKDKLYFWNTFGVNIHYLEFQDGCFFKEGLHFEGLQWLLASTPNLEQLKFGPCTALTPNYAMEDSDSEEESDEEEWDDEEQLITADKLKSLTISSKYVGCERTRSYFEGLSNVNGMIIAKELFSEDFKLFQKFLSLTPNLKSLEIIGLSHTAEIMKALRKPLPPSRTPLILEKFSTSNGHLNRLKFVELDLASYLKALGPAQNLKSLQLQIDFLSFWEHPSRLRNILKRIKPTITEMNFVLDCKYWSGNVPFVNRSFDLFSYNFDNLTRLTLQFHYESLHGESKFSYFSLDFNIFKGMPSLEYFRFESRPITKSPCLINSRNACNSRNLEFVRMESWHMKEGREREDSEDEEETEDPNLEVSEEPSQNEIILKRMKDFCFEGRLNEQDLLLLGKTMPNLESLEAILDSTTFPLSFTTWPKTLKQLNVILLNENQIECISVHRKYPNVQVFLNIINT